MRKRTLAGLTVLACAAGIATSESVYRSALCRDAIGELCGRGRLFALVNSSGIYQADLERQIWADWNVAGFRPRDSDNVLDPERKREALAHLIVAENLRHVSENQALSEANFKREFDLLQFQFADGKVWTQRLRATGLSANFIRKRLRDDLRARGWIDDQIAIAGKTSDEACRQFYAGHPDQFALPLRIRASHLFLAAPPETPPEIVEAKRKMIESLAARIAQGEPFSQLVAETSEDEATKFLSGDLGYLSAWRIPEDFFTAVSKLRINEIGKPLRSHLGFHLVQVTELRPPRQMTYEEARPEILGLLNNERRKLDVRALTRQMSARREYLAEPL